MSSGCGDVLSLEDLQTAKKHQTFEAEVITGKSGGVAGGADIDYATNPVTGQVQKTLPAVLRDTGFRPASFTFTTGGTLNTGDSDVGVLWPIADGGDGNYYIWKGALPKTIPAASTPASTGGVSSSAWMPIGDITLREELDTGDGSMIGTSHRSNLQNDLNAIDRRPDGYGNNFTTVLSNGQDVEVNQNYTRTAAVLPGDYQVVDGRGGSLQLTAIARAVSIVAKTGVVVRNLRAVGSVVNGPATGNVAYGIVAEDSSNIKIIGADVSQFTGAVEFLRTTDFVIRDIFARKERYHSDVVAGGYGVLLEGCQRGVVDGVNFAAIATDGDLGRHSIYISVDSSGNFCEDILVSNVIARYVNIDNRDMPPMVVRRSNRCAITNFNFNGANGGIGLNSANGAIQDFQARDGHIKFIQYDDNAVYGISGGTAATPNNVVGLKVDNVTFEMEVKSGVTPATIRLHALDVVCRDSQYTNIRFKSHGSSSPILVSASTINLVIDGVEDFVTAGVASSAALIRFQGSNSNISVFNIKTARTPFVGLDNVTDLTVNWERYARIVSNNGTLTLTDANSLFSTVSTTGTGEITVVFKNHVTADAVRNCTVTPASVAGLVILPEVTASRTLVLRFYNGSGTLVPLGSSIVSADIRLHS